MGRPGAAVARQVGSAAARHALVVVSGGASGVDRLAMDAALGAGGQVVGVLAGSILEAARNQATRLAITEGRLCLCSPHPPAAGFSAANALGRNKVIYALASATLVVASQEGRGGTWAGAAEALRRRTLAVLAWTGPGATDGNAALVALGAGAVGNIEELLPLLEGDQGGRASSGSEGPQQLSLGL